MCNCKIIPDYVLEKLELDGQNLELSNLQRVKRTAALIRRQVFSAVLGKGDRFVYNSRHSTDQRVDLSRQEADEARGDTDIDKAYDNAGIVRDYFAKELGWLSIDNRGMDMI